VKEPGFFTRTEYEWDLKDFQALWPGWRRRHKLALEGSTHYTKVPVFPNAAERIQEAQQSSGVSFKFIYIMRDPLERIESFYRHGVAVGRTPLPEKPDTPIKQHAVDLSLYARQLDEYYQRFSAEQILLLKFEDLVREPNPVMNTVWDFLDVPPVRVRTRPANKSIGRIEKRVSEEKDQARIEELERLKTWRLSDDQVDAVMQQLEPDMKRLREVYQFDTSGWCQR
jgi:hypothetical protein